MPSLTDNKNLKALPPTPPPVGRFCVPIPVPDDPHYLALFLGGLRRLSLQSIYDRDEAHTARVVAAYFRGLLREIETLIASGETCNPEIGEGDGCTLFLPQQVWIGYAPNDPFQTPEFIPPGYILPPFYNNPAIPLPGVMPTDAMVNLASLPVFADLSEIIASGLPRLRVHFSGEGEIEIELVRVPQGGLAYLTLDDNPTTGKFVDLNEVSIASIPSLEEIFDIILEGSIVATEIVEFQVTGTGNHHIDVTFLPNVGSDVIIGFGGGLRRVSLCGALVVGEALVPQIQLVDCNLEWRPHSGTAWVTLGNVCGEDGEDGQSIESVTAITTAEGTNAEAEYDPLTGALTLFIPRGDTGAQGVQGIQGEPGECPDCPPSSGLDPCRIANAVISGFYDDGLKPLLQLVATGIAASDSLATIKANAVAAWPFQFTSQAAFEDVVALIYNWETGTSGTQIAGAITFYEGSYLETAIQDLYCCLNDSSYLGTVERDCFMAELSARVFIGTVYEIFYDALATIDLNELQRMQGVYFWSYPAASCDEFTCADDIECNPCGGATSNTYFLYDDVNKYPAPNEGCLNRGGGAGTTAITCGWYSPFEVVQPLGTYRCVTEITVRSYRQANSASRPTALQVYVGETLVATRNLVTQGSGTTTITIDLSAAPVVGNQVSFKCTEASKAFYAGDINVKWCT